MKASLAAHAAAMEITDPVYINRPRNRANSRNRPYGGSFMGGAIYGLNALKLTGKSIEEEREWQNQRLQSLLPDEIVNLVLETRKVKEKGFKDLRD